MPELASDGRPDLLAGQRLPPPPRQERSRRKREALLAATLALFAERGYEATSIEEIARRAGVAVGGFYQHFASKRQALLVLMDQLLTEAAALASQGDDANPAPPRDAIAGLVRQGLRVDWAYAGAYRAWREAAAQDAAVRALYREVEEWTARQLERLVRALVQAPGARPGVDVPTLSWVLGLLFWRLAETPLDDADAVIAGVTELIIHALFVDDSDLRGARSGEWLNAR